MKGNRFEGHELFRVDCTHIFDMTEFILYESKVLDGDVEYEEVARVVKKGNTYSVIREHIGIPNAVIDTVVRLIERYYKDAYFIER